MDQTAWISLLIGLALGILTQSFAYPRLESYVQRRRRRRALGRATTDWNRIDDFCGGIVLALAGWDPEGSFPPHAVEMRLSEDDFQLTNPALISLRESNRSRWLEEGSRDDLQVGLKRYQALRIADDRRAESLGLAHALKLETHRYRHFDYRASHVLLANGNEAERAVVVGLVANANVDEPVAGFPTPCSVGLTLLCDEGAVLALTVRSESPASGGHLRGGLVFNAVGENATPDDFETGAGPAGTTSPDEVASRGLWEEVGISRSEQARGVIRLHSFAWDQAILDFKFFGYFLTSLSLGEVQHRRRSAPDRPESKGLHLLTYPVATNRECRKLVETMAAERASWAPEALFSTLRTLTVLGRISLDECVDVVARKV